jgi:hypothetical protein
LKGPRFRSSRLSLHQSIEPVSENVACHSSWSLPRFFPPIFIATGQVPHTEGTVPMISTISLSVTSRVPCGRGNGALSMKNGYTAAEVALVSVGETETSFFLRSWRFM